MNLSLFNLAESSSIKREDPIATADLRTNNVSISTAYLGAFNETATALTESMISSVSEAYSVKLENASMSEYFIKYSAELIKLINKLAQQKARFAINMNVFIDANESIMDNIVTCVPKNIQYNKTIYHNLTNPSVPNISPKKIFKKEYKALGRALQDMKSVNIADKNRIAVITTVYNALLSSIEQDWLDKCVQVITGDDDCKADEFSKTLYSTFIKGKDPVNIDNVEINQAKYVLSTASLMLRQIQDSFDTLADEIASVSDELNKVCDNNKKNAVDIETDEDGVENATYYLTDYSMNEFDKIIKTKIEQLNEVINLYIIALSVKMDCMLKALNQANEIITIASTGEAPDSGEMADDFGEEAELLVEEEPELDDEIGEAPIEDEEIHADYEEYFNGDAGDEEVKESSIITEKFGEYAIPWLGKKYYESETIGKGMSTLSCYPYVAKYVKRHSNPDYLKAISTSKSIDELKFIKKLIDKDKKHLPKVADILDGKIGAIVKDSIKVGAIAGTIGAATALIPGAPVAVGYTTYTQNQVGYGPSTSYNAFRYYKVTSSDIKASLKWIDNVALPAYEKKLAQLQNSVNEASIFRKAENISDEAIEKTSEKSFEVLYGNVAWLYHNYQDKSGYVAKYVKRHSNPDYLKAIKDAANKTELKQVMVLVKADIYKLPRIKKQLTTGVTRKIVKNITKSVIKGIPKTPMVIADMINKNIDIEIFEAVGVTVEDIDKTVDWLNSVVIPAYEKKLQSLPKNIHESAVIVLDEEAIFERDCYLFDIEMSRMSALIEQLEMQDRIYSMINEKTLNSSANNGANLQNDSSTSTVNGKAEKIVQQQSQSIASDVQKITGKNGNTPDQTQQDNNTTQQSNTVVRKVDNANSKNPSAAKEKINAIKEKINNLLASLVTKIRDLVNKFMEVVVNKNKKRSEEVRNHSKAILQNGANGGGTYVKYDTEYIKSMATAIEFSNYKNDLDSEIKFVKKAWNIDLDEGMSYKEWLADRIIPNKGQPVAVDGKVVADAVKYITQEFDIIAKTVQRDQNIITTKSKNAKLDAEKYMNESTLENTLLMYFNEGDFTAPTSDPAAANADNTQTDTKHDVVKKMMLMYRVNGIMLTTKMSMAQKAFNQYYSMCKFFMGNTVEEAKPETEEQSQQQQ